MKLQTRETKYNWIEVFITDGNSNVLVDIDENEAEDFSQQLLSALADTYRLMDYDDDKIKKSLNDAGLI
jgi:hypothetical protein